MSFRFKLDSADLQRGLAEAPKQARFAAAMALTRTAQDAQKAVTADLPKKFDEPTPFTQRAVGITRATKADLKAVVFVKDVQAGYLELQETGGERRPKAKALVVPAGARVNQYGNLPRKALATLKRRKNVFIGSVKGVGGVWERKKDGGLKLLIAFEPKAQYRPRFGFAPTVETVARRAFPDHFRRAFAQAMATARR